MTKLTDPQFETQNEIYHKSAALLAHEELLVSADVVGPAAAAAAAVAAVVAVAGSVAEIWTAVVAAQMNNYSIITYCINATKCDLL